MNKSLLVDAAIVLALIALGIVGYWFSPMLLPKSDVVVTPDVACDLNHADCAVALPGGGQLRLSLTPHPVPVAAPFVSEVVIEGAQAAHVAIDFSGADMNMGYNRQDLPATGDGRFAAQSILPVCVTGRMVWLATVLADVGRQRIAVPFRFEAGHPLLKQSG